jgi:hypothetical protein
MTTYPTFGEVLPSTHGIDLTPQRARDLLGYDGYLRDIASRLVMGETFADPWAGTEAFVRWVLARSLGNTTARKPNSGSHVCCGAPWMPRGDNDPHRTLAWLSRGGRGADPDWDTVQGVCRSDLHLPWTTRNTTKNASHRDYTGPIPAEFRERPRLGC